MRSLSLIGILALLAAGGFAFLRLRAPSSPPRERAPHELVPEAVAPPLSATRRPSTEPEDVVPAPDVAGISNAKKNQAAIALLEEGRHEEALRLFEECYAAAPDAPVFAKNLAETHARLALRQHESGDEETRALAIGHLEQAVELDPSREELAQLLARWRRTAETEEGFWRKLTEHFELSFDGTREELMSGTTPLENELESAYLEFGELFGHFPVESGRPRIRVVLYRREGFGSVTGLGDWAGGSFDGTVRVPVTDLGRQRDQLKEVLRHELLHAYAQEVGGSHVPGWLNEGLAQWLEPPFIDGRRVGVSAAEKKLAGRQLFTLDELGGSLASWSDTARIETAYAQSLAFVAYVERMYGERILFEMVAGCKVGQAPEETFRARIGDDLANVLADFALTLN